MRCRISFPWLTWDAYTEVSDVFAKHSQYPLTVDDEDLQILGKFVVIMYDRSSTAEGVDDARLDMFVRKQRPYEAIPPTRGALLQHTKRAAYQAGCIWSQSTVSKRQLTWTTNVHYYDIVNNCLAASICFMHNFSPIAQKRLQVSRIQAFRF